ncbi:MAG: glycosyltransferase, partial [Candidatus Acidiferrum sp.]
MNSVALSALTASYEVKPRQRVVNTRRVLAVVRWPVGGIRTHVLYNYFDAAAAGYRFTFVLPGDHSFETFAHSLRDMPDCEFAAAPARGNSCHLAPTVRRMLRTHNFDLIHSHGLTAASHAAIANIGISVPHITTVHDPLRPEQFQGLHGHIKRWTMGRVLS